MKNIESFNIDHIKLQAGLYFSREDKVGDRSVYTYDLRLTAPNDEPVMNTAEVHAIEHTGASFLRNHKQFGSEVIYFGPMGCRTGYYLILTDAVKPEDVLALTKEMFQYIAEYNGPVPGATPEGCGNYIDHNQSMAQYYSKNYLKVLEKVTDLTFSY